MVNFRKHHRLCLGAAAIALFAVPVSAAQAQADSQQSEEPAVQDDGGDSQEIIVTGTNISGVKQVGSESVVLSREEVLQSGKTSVAEVLRTLPQVQNAVGSFTGEAAGGSGNSQNGMTNPTRGSSINFRGVGQGATLTLVDGHRITPNGTATAFTEANQIPISAIERIEVIADGASAIYGSDAIAGVINYVMRKDFTGVEAGGRYTAGAYGNDEWALNATAGLHWSPGFGEGSVIATFEYGRRSPYVRGRNPRLAADQRPYGGQDNRVVGNAATVPINGNIVIPTANGLNNPNFLQGGAFTYYALPENPTGRILTIADLQEVRAGSCAGAATPNCATYPNVTDRSDVEDYLGRQTRYQAAIFLSQEIGGISFYDEFFWTRTKTFTRTFASGNQVINPTVSINPGSPYYLNLPNTTRSPFPPFVPASAQPITVQINLLARMPAGAPRFGNQNPDESFNNTFGARAGLFGDWKAEAYYTFGQDKNCGVCYLGNYIALETTNGITGAAATNALQNLINRPLGDPLHINPLSTAPFTDAQLDYILGTNSQYAQNWSHDVVAKVDGTLFHLPAGPLKAAFGGEYYHGLQKLQNDANRPPDPGPVITPDARARTTRTQYAGFAELYLPLISDEMDIPLVQELTVNGAIRYDHYSDFGSTTNEKVSAVWKLADALRLRGSWGTSFRAPGLPELNAGVFSVGLGTNVTPGADVTDITRLPNGTVNALSIIGNNPNLKPETGTNWQVGADLTPPFLPGLRLSATYYNLKYENKLGTSGVPLPIFAPGPLANAALENLYRPYVIPIHNTNVTATGCTLDPNLQQFVGFLYSANIGFNPRDYCNINVVVDSRGISAANTFQDGLDLNASYVTTTGAGTFRLNLGASKIFTAKQRTVAGAPMISVLDTIGNPISWRGRGSLSYSTGPFSATLFGNYVGPYTNDKPISIQGVVQPVSRVGSWTTFDLNLSVAFPDDDARWSFMRGTRIGLTVTNLFEQEPPIVQSSVSGSSSIDLYTHNAFGRYMQVQIIRSF